MLYIYAITRYKYDALGFGEESLTFGAECAMQGIKVHIICVEYFQQYLDASISKFNDMQRTLKEKYSFTEEQVTAFKDMFEFVCMDAMKITQDLINNWKAQFIITTVALGTY